MARLYRPHIPLAVRCAVAERQLVAGCGLSNAAAITATNSFGARLKILLAELAGKLGCEVSDLRLDHDPPLGARAKVPAERYTKSCWLNSFSVALRYEPDANDPEYLFYRPHGAEFIGSHDVKTRIRGDHGQHPDRVLIKKQRRIERGPKPKRGPKIRSRGFSSAKQKLPSRPFPKREK